VYFIKQKDIMACGEVEVQLHVFLSSALDKDELPASLPCTHNPQLRAFGIYWIED
jgi:hypothetical protein